MGRLLLAGWLGLSGLAGCGYEYRWAAVDGDTAFLTEHLDKGELDARTETPILRTSLLSLAAAHGHMDTVKALVDRGADVNAADATGWTPLHAAAYGGHPEIIRYLLDQGALSTADNWYTPTPLGVAEALHHQEAVKVLRAVAAEPRATPRTQLTGP